MRGLFVVPARFGDLPGLAELAEDLDEWYQGWAEEPSLPDEALEAAGGYCFERAYLLFRHPPPESAQGEALEAWRENGLASQRLRALDHALVPTDEEVRATYWAIELHSDRERYGSPYGGGHYDQPSGYLYAVECVEAARERAERVNRALEAQGREQEKQEAETPELGEDV